MPGPSPHPDRRRGPEPTPTRTTPAPHPRETSSPDRGGLHSALKGSTFEEGVALLAPPAAAKTDGPPTYPAAERSTRTEHERRMALASARANLEGKMRAAIVEKYLRDRAALDAFAGQMTFAEDDNVVELLLGAAFTSLVGVLPNPLSAAVGTITLVAGAYSTAQATSKNVTLKAWILAHRDDLEAGREAQVNTLQAPELQPLDEAIERLVVDDTQAGQQRIEAWERAISAAVFPVTISSSQLEVQLYEAWCYGTGAYFVANMFRNDVRYPGDEAPGIAGDGVQVAAPKLPPQILARLKGLGLDPVSTLKLPRELHHHDRIAPGEDRWRLTHTTRDMPYTGERKEQWPGPERFKQP